jgi:hypothetical protein
VFIYVRGIAKTGVPHKRQELGTRPLGMGRVSSLMGKLKSMCFSRAVTIGADLGDQQVKDISRA